MELIFVAGAQSSSVDNQTGRLSLFHILEQVQVTAFPSSLSLTLVGVFAKDADEPDDQSVRLKVELGDTVVFDSPVAISFRGKLRNRVLTAMNGLGVPGPGALSFSFLSESGRPLGAAWVVAVEKAVSSVTVPLKA